MARDALDRNRIVAEALDLVDEVGLDGLSTRVLAGRLGVQSPALYWHFRNKGELVAAMAEAMMLPAPDAQAAAHLTGGRVSRASVSAWLVGRGELFRRSLLSRRDGARIHAGSRPPDQQLSGVEAQLVALQRVGLEPAAGARVSVSISRFVVGWVLEEQSEHAHPGFPDAAAYPALAAALAAVEGTDPDVEFTICLTAVVDGLLRHRRHSGPEGSASGRHPPSR